MDGDTGGFYETAQAGRIGIVGDHARLTVANLDSAERGRIVGGHARLTVANLDSAERGMFAENAPASEGVQTRTSAALDLRPNPLDTLASSNASRCTCAHSLLQCFVERRRCIMLVLVGLDVSINIGMMASVPLACESQWILLTLGCVALPVSIFLAFQVVAVLREREKLGERQTIEAQQAMQALLDERDAKIAELRACFASQGSDLATSALRRCGSEGDCIVVSQENMLQSRGVYSTSLNSSIIIPIRSDLESDDAVHDALNDRSHDLLDLDRTRDCSSQVFPCDEADLTCRPDHIGVDTADIAAPPMKLAQFPVDFEMQTENCMPRTTDDNVDDTIQTPLKIDPSPAHLRDSLPRRGSEFMRTVLRTQVETAEIAVSPIEQLKFPIDAEMQTDMIALNSSQCNGAEKTEVDIKCTHANALLSRGRTLSEFSDSRRRASLLTSKSSRSSVSTFESMFSSSSGLSQRAFSCPSLPFSSWVETAIVRQLSAPPGYPSEAPLEQMWLPINYLRQRQVAGLEGSIDGQSDAHRETSPIVAPLSHNPNISFPNLATDMTSASNLHISHALPSSGYEARLGDVSTTQARAEYVYAEDHQNNAFGDLSKKKSSKRNSLTRRWARRNSQRLWQRDLNVREKLLLRRRRSDGNKFLCADTDDHRSELATDASSCCDQHGSCEVGTTTSVDVVALQNQIFENALLHWQQDDDDTSVVSPRSGTMNSSTVLSPLAMHPKNDHLPSDEARTSGPLLVGLDFLESRSQITMSGRRDSLFDESAANCSTHIEYVGNLEARLSVTPKQPERSETCKMSEDGCSSAEGHHNVVQCSLPTGRRPVTVSEPDPPMSQFPSGLLPRTGLVPPTPSPTPPCSPFLYHDQDLDSSAQNNTNLSDGDSHLKEDINKGSLLESMLQRLTIKDDIIVALKALSPGYRREGCTGLDHGSDNTHATGTNATQRPSKQKGGQWKRCQGHYQPKANPNSANAHHMRTVIVEARVALLACRKKLLQERAQRRALTANLSEMTTQVQLLRVLLAVFAHHLEQNGVLLADLSHGVFP